MYGLSRPTSVGRGGTIESGCVMNGIEVGVGEGKFRFGQNWVSIEARGRQVLYRCLGETQSRVFFIKLGDVVAGTEVVKLLKPSSDERHDVLKRHLLSRIEDGRFYSVSERGLATLQKVDAPEEIDPYFKVKKALVDYIDRAFGEVIFFDEREYRTAMARAAEEFDVALASAKKWYAMHLFFARDYCATFVRNADKGKSDASSANVRGRPGRLNAFERTYPNSQLTAGRKRLHKKLRTRLLRFVNQSARQGATRLSDVIQRFRATLVGYNRAEDGTLVVWPQNLTKVPSAEYLMKVARSTFVEGQDWYRRRRDRAVGTRRPTGAGSTRDLADDELPMFDIDATPLDNYLKLGGKNYAIDGVERPILLLAVDRRSTAIVGWYLYFGNENNEAYRSCIFSAFTDKFPDLVRWGVPHLQGMVHGFAACIFVDRGPCVAAASAEAIVRHLRIHMVMAEPGDPPGKGLVERVIGTVTKALTNVRGSVHPTNDVDETRIKIKKAKKIASHTLEEFMPELLKAISEHNQNKSCAHLMTKELLDAGVQPIPSEIFLYNKQKSLATDVWEWKEDEIYTRLCTPFTSSAEHGIVSVRGLEFASKALDDWAHLYHRLKGKWPNVEGYIMPCAPNHLLWRADDGSLRVLTSRVKREDTYLWDHEYIVTRAKADMQKKGHLDLLKAVKRRCEQDVETQPKAKPRPKRGGTRKRSAEEVRQERERGHDFDEVQRTSALVDRFNFEDAPVEPDERLPLPPQRGLDDDEFLNLDF